MMRGRRRGLARTALPALVLACAALVAAAPASAFRSPKGAKPTVKVLTKDQPSAAKARSIRLRVTVGTRSRVRLRVLATGIAKRPVFAVAERKIRFGAGSGRLVNLRLTKKARRGIAAAIGACRNVTITAFASGRQLTRRGDNPRTTLVRHSRTLKHRRKSCGAGGFGSPDSVTLPPSFGGGPGGSEPGPNNPFGPGPPPRIDPGEPVTIRAGAASTDITPPIGTPMFAYTARSQVFGPDEDKFMQILGDPDENFYAKTFAASRGIHTRVLSRAIVVESGGRKFALVHVDLGGVPYALTQEVEKRIAQTGISGERMMLSATHTHSSSGAIWSADNLGYGFVGGDAYDPRIFEITASQIAQSIIDANSRLTPARVGVGSAELRGASRNREFEPFTRNPETPKDAAAARAASIDPRVTVIRVDDVAGRPLAVWSNFAIHPTSFGDENLLFSGDNAATTERYVEEAVALDARSRDAGPTQPPVNVWTNGTEGDVSPDGGSDVDPNVPPTIKDSKGENVTNPEKFLDTAWTSSAGGANKAGARTAAGIYAAWLDAGAEMRGTQPIDIRRNFMVFDGSQHGGEPVGPHPVLGWGGIAPSDDAGIESDGFCAPFPDFAGPGQGMKFPLLVAPGAVPNIQPVSLLRFGPLAVASFPSEITTQAGRRIKDAILKKVGTQAPEGAIIAGLTNSYASYTATPEEYDACTYEGSFTLWGRQQASKYRDLASALAGNLYGGEAAPASGPEPPQVSPGTPQSPMVRETPEAGAVVEQPKDVQRLQKAVFRWRAGDAAVDPERGKPFVTLQQRTGGAFTDVATEDSLFDTTEMRGDTEGNEVWTHTFEFHECVPTGTYRFLVRGMANKGDGVKPYTATSREFRVDRQTGIRVFEKSAAGGVARVRAEYPRSGDTLTALPQRVRTGFAALRVRDGSGAESEVFAFPSAGTHAFEAPIPAGATFDVVSVQDACLNTGR